MISVRFSGTLVYLLGIDVISLTQFIDEKIWLMMHPYSILFYVS